MTTGQQLVAAKKQAQEQLRNLPGVAGFGLEGDQRVRVYLTDQKFRDGLPDSVDGIGIAYLVVGENADLTFAE